MEGEHTSVVLPECSVLHVIEDTCVTKALPDPLRRPSVVRHGDLDMKEPVGRSTTFLQHPWLNQEGRGRHEDGARVDGRVSLPRIVKTSKEMADLVWRDEDVPVREAKLVVELIGHICHTCLGVAIKGKEQDRLAAQLLELGCHGARGNHCHPTLV
jgi:hypothetical protein